MLPVRDAELFVFKVTIQPESVLLLKRGDALLSAHGSFLSQGAKAAVRAAFEKTYGSD